MPFKLAYIRHIWYTGIMNINHVIDALPLTSKRIKDIRGKRFGRLLVLKFVASDRYKTVWLCGCDCGNIVEVRSGDLGSGHTKSCGCLKSDAFQKTITKHGLSKLPEYKIWINMKVRCYNPNHRAYHNYGGRGIVVCEQWRVDFASFYADMGPRPALRYSVDRIDNNGPYSPENCRWATAKEQANNSRMNKHVTFKNETHTLSEWADILDIEYGTFTSRFYRGASYKQIISDLKSSHGSSDG